MDLRVVALDRYADHEAGPSQPVLSGSLDRADEDHAPTMCDWHVHGGDRIGTSPVMSRMSRRP
jgi:hypothetical protein